jgi:hypothetical protein
MTPQELENIERAFDKAKMAGPQALHDWAVTFAPLLFLELKHLPPIASDDPANDAPAFNYGDPRRITDALRPFAALGAPVCLTALEEYRILNDLPDELAVFAVPDMNTGEGSIAFVTTEQLKAAHDLINEIDGGTGA